jgi:hypothetical protein
MDDALHRGKADAEARKFRDPMEPLKGVEAFTRKRHVEPWPLSQKKTPHFQPGRSC